MEYAKKGRNRDMIPVFGLYGKGSWAVLRLLFTVMRTGFCDSAVCCMNTAFIFEVM
jgi:hypothetical protein